MFARRKRYGTEFAALILCAAILSGCGVAGSAGTGAAENDVSETAGNDVSETAENDVSETANERVIMDSLGREVVIPTEVNNIIPTGQLAQIVLLSLCPEKMVCIASKWDEKAEEYIPDEVRNLPRIGQVYGGKQDFSMESVLALNPDVIIDIGDDKKGMEEDLDRLQEQMGVPIVHLNGALSNLPETYKALGEITGKTDEAKMRGDYCERKNSELEEISAKLDSSQDNTAEIGSSQDNTAEISSSENNSADSYKINALLVTGPEGLNVVAKGAYQAEAFDAFANNLAVIDNPSGKGTGNEVSMEQIILWNPEYIIYLSEATPAEVFEGDRWQSIDAVKKGQVYPAPFGPYNWLGFPSAIQKYLGMMWMADKFYPDETEFDLYTEVKEYYKLFYGYDLSEEKFARLVGNK